MIVTEEYLSGIREGRQTRRMIEATDVERTAKIELEFLDRVGTMYGSEPSAEFCRGLRDFWQNQMKSR